MPASAGARTATIQRLGDRTAVSSRRSSISIICTSQRPWLTGWRARVNADVLAAPRVDDPLVEGGHSAATLPWGTMATSARGSDVAIDQ
jgi:hypothetical protein